MLNDLNGSGAVNFRIGRRACPQAVDVAIAHSEHCRDQYRVMSLSIGGSFLTGIGNVLRRHELPVLLHLARDVEQSLQLRGHIRIQPVRLDFLH